MARQMTDVTVRGGVDGEEKRGIMGDDSESGRGGDKRGTYVRGQSQLGLCLRSDFNIQTVIKVTYCT